MSAADAIYSRADDAISCDLPDGLAILDSASNRYFSLNAVGACVWNALPKSVPDLAALIVQQYDVSSEQAIADIGVVLADLEHEGLVWSDPQT